MNARAQREIDELTEEVEGIITHLTTEYGPEAFVSRLIERCGGDLCQCEYHGEH